MTKTLLTKMRKWDENIGKLIVFAVTIIIAVGVLGTLAYFYNQSRKTASKIAVLTSINSSADDLAALKVCTGDSSAKVKYDARTGIYGVVCAGTLNTGNISNVKGLKLLTNCKDSPGVLSGTAQACYKSTNNDQ